MHLVLAFLVIFLIFRCGDYSWSMLETVDVIELSQFVLSKGARIVIIGVANIGRLEIIGCFR